MVKAIFVATAFAVLCPLSRAHSTELTVGWPFASNMVLQRDKAIQIKGTAEPGASVAIDLRDQKLNSVADNLGHWTAKIQPLKLGEPLNLKVTAGQKEIVLTNILVGDVWFLSGQSNMQMPVKDFTPASQWLENSDFPEIRFCTLPDYQPNTSVDWSVCTKETASNFSAVGFLFGRELSNSQKIPIGLLDASHGGSIISKWISAEGLAQIPEEIEKLKEYHLHEPARKAQMAEYQAEQNRRKTLDQAAVAILPKLVHPGTGFRPQSSLYNTRIKQALPFAIKGALWYQGESDGMFGMGKRYVPYLKALITSWRQEFDCGEFPFIIVQLPNYGKCAGWPPLREAQREVTRTIPNTGLVVTIDLGESQNIHPNEKLILAERASVAALSLAYKVNDKKLPIFLGSEVKEENMILSFENIDSGLFDASGTPIESVQTHFELAGSNKVFRPATATVEGGKLIVYANGIKAPQAVRYLWAQDPKEGFVFNKDGFPLGPFRTDSW